MNTTRKLEAPIDSRKVIHKICSLICVYINDLFPSPSAPRVIYPKYTLIFVGTADGSVVNVDEASGERKNILAVEDINIEFECLESKDL